MHIKVHSRSTETSCCLYCMKTVEQKCFAPSNRPQCDLGLPFKERLPSPSNTRVLPLCRYCTWTSHPITAPDKIFPLMFHVKSSLNNTQTKEAFWFLKHQHSEWNLKISGDTKMYPYSSFFSLWFPIKHSKSLPPSTIFVLLLSIHLDPCFYCLSEISIIYSTNPVWVRTRTISSCSKTSQRKGRHGTGAFVKWVESDYCKT